MKHSLFFLQQNDVLVTFITMNAENFINFATCSRVPLSPFFVVVINMNIQSSRNNEETCENFYRFVFFMEHFDGLVLYLNTVECRYDV